MTTPDSSPFQLRHLKDGSPYRLFVPQDYDPNKAWPLILFLHGSGERGTDDLAPTGIGLGPALLKHPERYPALVIFPQAPAEGSWQGEAGTRALAAVEEVEATFNIDPKRRYLTGLSLGGNGVWHLLWRSVDRWAAAAPVCGYAMAEGRAGPKVAAECNDPLAALVQCVGPTPLWIFHGDADTVVPVRESQLMAEALLAAGGQARLTLYPGMNHGIWDEVYGSEDFSNWLFGQVQNSESI